MLTMFYFRNLKKVMKTAKTRQEKIQKWVTGMNALFPAWGDTSKLLKQDAEFLEDQRSLR